MKVLLGSIASILLLTTRATSVDAANVPDWVKNNAGWWAAGQIDDTAFVSGVQYMVENGIINVQVDDITRCKVRTRIYPFMSSIPYRIITNISSKHWWIK